MNREPDEEVATAIQLTALCQGLKALPRVGGVLDQDSYHIFLIQAVLEAQAERQEKELKEQQRRMGG